MLRDLPNLDWLRVFAATAETESFALAAARLGVTSGAVSQRIKALETFLGIGLFQRYPQGVKLTDAGRRYAQRVSPSLQQLSAATRELTASSSARTVRVTVLPAFAQLWLGPRLDHFHAQHTNTSVEIWADAAVIDLRVSNFDLAIRYGRPPFHGCEHRPLLFDELVPVAAPSLIAASTPDARGLPTGAPLMMDTYWEHDFGDWLGQTGRARAADPIIQTFSLYSMVVDATLQGRGFMIGHTALLDDHLRRGDLRVLLEERVPARNQFHLLTKAGATLSEAAETFVAWLTAQAESQT
jgi:LysR family glycine cleavage system transcriptional activator